MTCSSIMVRYEFGRTFCRLEDLWKAIFLFGEISYFWLSSLLILIVHSRCQRWQPVRVIFGHHMWVCLCHWAIELARVMRKIPHFGIGIVWGAMPMSFPVFWISVSGRFLNSYGTSPNLWVQKKLVKFWQGTKDTWLRFAKFLRELLGYPSLNLPRDLGDVILG